mgnify:CR=1 FL=1|jgi:TatD DNase family protein
MFTDSHCHLASKRFCPEEIPAVLERARLADVTRMITLATSLDDVPANLLLAENPAIHACIGIHPCDVHHAPDDAVAKLATYAADPRVCAIGETGLDFYHPAPDEWEEQRFRDRQKAMLREHFELAATHGLNIVIHTRDREEAASFEAALAIYREFHASVRAVFHCFIGPWENAKRVLDLGGLVSFGGVATFKSAHLVRETILRCPSDCFMLETDSPYLAPEPHRGKRNEPSFVRDTAVAIAAWRGEPLESLAWQTGETASRFFRLRAHSI